MHSNNCQIFLMLLILCRRSMRSSLTWTKVNVSEKHNIDFKRRNNKSINFYSRFYFGFKLQCDHDMPLYGSYLYHVTQNYQTYGWVRLFWRGRWLKPSQIRKKKPQETLRWMKIVYGSTAISHNGVDLFP